MMFLKEDYELMLHNIEKEIDILKGQRKWQEQELETALSPFQVAKLTAIIAKIEDDIAAFQSDADFFQRQR